MTTNKAFLEVIIWLLIVLCLQTEDTDVDIVQNPLTMYNTFLWLICLLNNYACCINGQHCLSLANICHKVWVYGWIKGLDLYCCVKVDVLYVGGSGNFVTW